MKKGLKFVQSLKKCAIKPCKAGTTHWHKNECTVEISMTAP